MIWLWIIISLVLSLIPLINKKIDLANYIWLLIPIDAYGITLASATVKPYMILAFLLPIIMVARHKGQGFDITFSKGQFLAGVITVLILFQSTILPDNMAGVKGSIMAILVYVCAQLCVSCTDPLKKDQLSDVFIASCFGCSIIFIVAHLCLQRGINISGIVATDRAQSGMFMQMTNMSDGTHITAYRLRGFAYDPNTMFQQFIFGITACVSKLFKKFNLYHIITAVMSIICILLSSSRMGLLCCVVSIVIISITSISQFDNTRAKILATLSALSLSVMLLLISLSNFGQKFISSLLSTYQNRSTLTDEYGRFSIWKECLSVYWDENPILGVGLGRMKDYTATERMTHNTWLQFICECGIIVGAIVIIYFLSVMLIGWSKTRRLHHISPDNSAYLCLVLGFTMTIISLASADNITCSYLWFSALLVLKLAFYNPENNISINQKSQ